MDAEYANYYTREVMLILIREFQSPDEEMKKIVLKVSGNWLASWCELEAAHSRLFSRNVAAAGLVVRYINTSMRLTRNISCSLSGLTLHPLVTFSL